MAKIDKVTPTVETNIKQKRGRKPKKKPQEVEINALDEDNIVCIIEDNVENSSDASCENKLMNELNENININTISDADNDIDMIVDNESQTSNAKIVTKKRGRKPKGGKIIQQIIPLNNNKDVKPNIILHLKCSLKELQNADVGHNVESFHFPSCKNELKYEIINSKETSSTSLTLNHNSFNIEKNTNANKHY
jgi:hypothetical protein